MGPYNGTSESTVDASMCRFTRATKGTFQSTKYIDEANLTSDDRLAQCDSYTTHLAYLAEISI